MEESFERDGRAGKKPGVRLLDTVGGFFAGTKTMAKKAYDLKSLENKIKACKKEEAELYLKLGRLYYHESGADEPEPRPDREPYLSACKDIDSILYRIHMLEKQISEVRQGGGAEYAKMPRGAAPGARPRASAIKPEPKPGAGEREPDREQARDFNAEDHKRLSKKGSDLVIVRTNHGIQLMRTCPVCQAKNPNGADACESCGHLFSRRE